MSENKTSSGVINKLAENYVLDKVPSFYRKKLAKALSKPDTVIVVTLTSIQSTDYRGIEYAVFEYDKGCERYVLGIQDDGMDDGLFVNKWPLQLDPQIELVVPARLETEYAKWNAITGISPSSMSDPWDYY